MQGRRDILASPSASDSPDEAVYMISMLTLLEGVALGGCLRRDGEGAEHGGSERELHRARMYVS